VAVSFRHEPDRDLLIPHGGGGRIERPAGLAGIAAVDDEVARELVEPPEDGDFPDLALAGGDRALRKDGAERHDVQDALVVADDDAGPEGLEPLAVLDRDPPAHHAGQPAAEDLAEDVEGLAVAGRE